MYRVIFKDSAVKEIKRLRSVFSDSVSAAIDNLSINPRPPGSKKLKGSSEYLWRIRIGDYRVIYLIDDKIKIINVRRVAHRRDIYR